MSFGARGKTKKKKGGNLNENKVEKSNKCDTYDYAMPTHDPDDPRTTPPADNPPTDDDGGLGINEKIQVERLGFFGRGRRTRTHDTQFWRLVFYRLNYTPIFVPDYYTTYFFFFQDLFEKKLIYFFFAFIYI